MRSKTITAFAALLMLVPAASAATLTTELIEH